MVFFLFLSLSLVVRLIPPCTGTTARPARDIYIFIRRTSALPLNHPAFVCSRAGRLSFKRTFHSKSKK